MPGRIVFVLVIAAFCAGALTDRALSFYTTPPLQLDPVPLPSADVPTPIPPGGVTMQTCLASSVRQGMTRDQAIHACNEVVK
jgi:hypothetical protein